MTEFEEEKFSLILQINELYQIIDLTQQNLTNAIHQVTKRRKKSSFQIIISCLVIKQKSTITRASDCIRTASTNN